MTELEDGFPVHYFGVEDLIRAKMIANRPQDVMDVSEIKRVQDQKK